MANPAVGERIDTNEPTSVDKHIIAIHLRR